MVLGNLSIKNCLKTAPLVRWAVFKSQFCGFSALFSNEGSTLMFRIGFVFIFFGITAFLLFTPAHTSGKIALAIMSVIFILVGMLYVWVGIQKIKNDK